MRLHFFLAGGVALLTGVCGSVAYATGTAAGVNISNTASASFVDNGGQGHSVHSNTTVLRIDEVLNVTLVSNNAGNVSVTSPEANASLSFKITNTGNGSEPYALSFKNNLPADQFDPGNTRIYLDNGDGVFDPLVDTLYVPGSNEPVLAADSSRVVFVVSDIPAGHSGGDIGLASLKAEAVTAQATPGSHAPGTTFAGKGDNGTDAVVGNSRAEAQLQAGYVISQATTSLTKSQSVDDGSGGSNPVSGATITYTLVFAATGSGTLTGAKIVDAIPANTTYIPGSLTLDAVALTDAGDADAGRFTSTQVEVALNTVVAPATHTVTFRVKIN